MFQLYELALITEGFMMACFLLAWIFQTERYYDISACVSFLSLISYTYTSNSDPSTRQTIASLLSAVWTLRLGTFLFYRVIAIGEDRRFAKIKVNALWFFISWFLNVSRRCKGIKGHCGAL